MNPLKAGDIAPKFSLPDQDGEQVNLTDFQGQRVLVYSTESHDPRLYRTGLRLTR
ncbi:thioredoxin-dependent thiol peroxidase [Escherichia coli]|uniref:Thioredoxin-dependent thiol peroxidase n=1 Tax=Escherichia coli TaxID=562 RepID=A0A484X1U4_ECOLX|nr:thioredoxin-dependent thiol peroxidase [Escherichia coli]